MLVAPLNYAGMRSFICGPVLVACFEASMHCKRSEGIKACCVTLVIAPYCLCQLFSVVSGVTCGETTVCSQSTASASILTLVTCHRCCS